MAQRADDEKPAGMVVSHGGYVSLCSAITGRDCKCATGHVEASLSKSRARNKNSRLNLGTCVVRAVEAQSSRVFKEHKEHKMEPYKTAGRRIRVPASFSDAHLPLLQKRVDCWCYVR